MWYVPSDANGLLHLQRSRQGLHVDLIDLVDAQSCADKNQGRVECPPIRFCHRHERVLVDVGVVACGIDAQGALILVRQCPVRVNQDSSRGMGRRMAYWMQRAVAEGPNHSPGYLPQATAP